MSTEPNDENDDYEPADLGDPAPADERGAAAGFGRRQRIVKCARDPAGEARESTKPPVRC